MEIKPGKPLNISAAMDCPLVSCIIPTYNRAKYVKEAIDSALSQDYASIEVIVVDDGSTDGTPDVLAGYGDKIVAVRQQNSGTAAARNSGIAASKGQFIAWLDSDDAWLPEKIRLQIDAFRQFPDAGLIYTHGKEMDCNSLPSAGPLPAELPGPRIRTDALAMTIRENEIMPTSVIVRREILDVVGWFDPKYLWEDWELIFRIAQKYAIVEVPVALCRIRVHDIRKTADRYLHAKGIFELRKSIEAAKENLIAHDKTGLLQHAYREHDAKFTEEYYRLGKYAAQHGEIEFARRMLAEARRRNPWVIKYYTRAAGLIFVKPSPVNSGP